MQEIAFRLAVILVFMIPWEGAVTLEGFGTLARIIGLVVAALWATTVVSRFGARRPDAFHVAALLFVVWNAVSLFWSVQTDLTVQRILTLSQLLILTYILWDLTGSTRALRSLLQAYVLGAYVSVISTIANLMRGGDAEIRFAGSEMDENELAVTLALALPVAWLLATSKSTSRLEQFLRLANYVYLPSGIFAIILTASRTGIFAIIPAAVFMFLTLPRLRLPARIVISTALAGAFLFLYPLVPSGTLERLATIESSIASADLGGRVVIWREGTRSFIKHPVLGVGGGAFERAVPRTQAEAHNIMLSVVVELGIAGLALFAMMLAIAGYRALKQPRRLSNFWMTVLLTWAIGAIALTWEHRKPTWLFLGLIVISSALHSQDRSAAVAQPSLASAPRSRA